MGSRYRQTRITVASILLAASVAAVGTVASAAIPALDISTPDRFVAVSAPNGVDVTFTLRRPNGVLKERITDTATDGRAEAEFDAQLKAGDRLTVRRGGERRTITLQRLELTAIDRVGDVITGRGTPGRTVKVRVHQCALGSGFSNECPDALRRRLVLGGSGTFRLDTTGDVNLRGFQHVDVRMRSSAGDDYRDERDVPVMFIEIGRPFISMAGVKPCSTVDGILLDAPGGTVIAATQTTSGCGLRLRNGAVDVDVASGNQLLVDFATDARMTIPAMIESVDPGTDVVTGTCFPNQPFFLNVFGPGGGQFSGVAAPDGSIDIDMTGTVDLVPAHDLRLRCMNVRGDSVREE